MRLKLLPLIVLSIAFISSGMTSGCSARITTGYRVHDAYRGDDHVWDNDEVAFYGRWETETQRRHEDFRHRPAAEQQEYWTWRHNQR
jgi:hypothetical protein